MLSHFGCGTFHHEYDDELCLASPGSSPKKPKRKDNNPYSTRGLDKFSALLADLDEKRQKIYSQMSPHDISFVRFVHSSTDDFVPIVVKVKNKEQNKHKSQELKAVKATRQFTSPTSEPVEKFPTTDSRGAVAEETSVKKTGPDIELVRATKKIRFTWNTKRWDIWRPSFYVPMVMILILVFLTVFGRSVTTLCTCILWYIIPAFKDRSSNLRKSMMKKKDYVRGVSEKKMVVKKDYVRWMSENKMVVKNKKDYVRGWSEKIATDGLLSPTRSGGGDSEASENKSSSGKHGHKKSWS